ncbi:MAG: 50S ribosomal protein L22 [Planctomycetota bacterium]|nr:50S ribosomal protein L22 [Planctomycetota bacterium]MDG1982963.1 50S ribosomal protein L22 [Planctomycetota bacterium]
MKNEIIRELGGYVARHRYARISARKARLVADAVRGRAVNDALEILELLPQRGAAFYKKVLLSAIANASQDDSVDVNDLFVSDCRADDGPMLNNRLRYRPGPQGRAMPYAKKTSHLTVIVAQASAFETDSSADAEAASA